MMKHDLSKTMKTEKPDGQPRQVLHVSLIVKQWLRQLTSEDDLSSSEQMTPPNWAMSPASQEPDCERSDVFDLELSQVQKQYNLHAEHRGKWTLDYTYSGSKVDLHEMWQKVSEAVNAGKLSGCTAVFKEDDHSIWVYCNFGECLQTHKLLKETLSLPSMVDFVVPQHGCVLSR